MGMRKLRFWNATPRFIDGTGNEGFLL